MPPRMGGCGASFVLADQLLNVRPAGAGQGYRLNSQAFMIQHRSGQVVFRWNTLDSTIAANLGQNGFMSTFGGPLGPWRGNSIPFREDRRLEAHGFWSRATSPRSTAKADLKRPTGEQDDS